MPSARDKLLGQFRELVIERLEKIGKNLMKLEGGPDPESGKAALRELHGLKGEARMMGFADVNTLVHEMEELVRSTEKGGYALQPQSANALLVASSSAREVNRSSYGPGVISTTHGVVHRRDRTWSEPPKVSVPAATPMLPPDTFSTSA